MKEKIGSCTKCGSDNLLKNGHTSNGKQQYYCKNCGAHRILESEKRYTEERKGEIIRAYLERASLRGIERVFHISRETVSEWIKKNNIPIAYNRRNPYQSKR